MRNRKRRLAALLLAASLGCLGIGLVSVRASEGEIEIDFADNTAVENSDAISEAAISKETELTVEEEEINLDNDEVMLEEETSKDMVAFEDGETNSETEDLTEEETRPCGVEENTVFWSLNEEGVLKITGQGAMQNWKSEEAVPWNYRCQEIKKIEIEDGVTSIGEYAFSNCINVTETEIPESVQEIGQYAFFNCSGLFALTIG